MRRLAVSKQEDFVVFSGSRPIGGSLACGIYRVWIATGKVDSVREGTDCANPLDGGSPDVEDVSADAKQALLKIGNTLRSVDLSTGSIVRLEGQLWRGAYSPDGNWIAALELGTQRPSKTILIDRQNPSARRDLGGISDQEVVWSPDSRTLLHVEVRKGCPAWNLDSLEIVDIETGKRVSIEKSVCRSGRGDRKLGWVRSNLGA